jgi:predicted RNA-binding Zn-ribbon protein involved in translation (DUF1610 family)
MECTTCKQILTTDSNHQIDGKNYCPGCADVSSFADMCMKENSKSNLNFKPKENIKLPNKQIIINYRCIKCHKDTSGNNCQHCGYLSPLSNPRRKKI